MKTNSEFFVRRDSCPVCGSLRAKQIYSCALTDPPVRSLIESHYRSQGEVPWETLAGTDYVLCECADCRLVFQSNAPNDRMLDIIYNKMISPDWLTGIESERLTADNFNSIANELQYLFGITGKHPRKITLLDYGFGHGRWARVARAMGATVFATEIGDEKIRTASQIGVTIIDDEEIDAAKFDIVHTEQVFEHLVEPAVTFGRLARATAICMKVAVPRCQNIATLLKRRGMKDWSPLDGMISGGKLDADAEDYLSILPLEHLNAYRPKTVQYLAGRHAMTIAYSNRRRVTKIDLSHFAAAMKSAISAAATPYRNAKRRNDGYFVLRPIS